MLTCKPFVLDERDVYEFVDEGNGDENFRQNGKKRFSYVPKKYML